MSRSLAVRDERWHRALASRWLWLTVALLVLLYLSWPSFRISLGLIDDHEIVEIIGPHNRLPFGEILTTSLQRSDESLGRFRPMYWVLRTLEAATAGKDATWWYVHRFVLAAITMVAIFLTVARFTLPPLAGAIALLPFVGVQAETWSRLGPNEAYALPLLAVGAGLVIRDATHARRPAAQWLGYGFLLASGLAKENFLPVAVVVIAWSGLHFGMRRYRLGDWAVLGITALVALANLAAIAVKVREFGGVYPQERSLQTVRAWLHFATSNLDQSSRLTTGVFLALMMWLLIRRHPTRRVAVGVAVVVVAVALLQSLFYAGGPLPGRYLYPFALLSVVGWTCASHLVSGEPSPRRRVAAYGVIALALALPLVDGITAARAASRASVAATASFQANLSSLESQIKAVGATTVVMQPYEPTTDLEPALSLARYLVARDGLTVMTLPAPQAAEGYSADLNRLLTRWSRRGNDSMTPYRKTDDCVSVVFGSAEPICASALPPAL